MQRSAYKFKVEQVHILDKRITQLVHFNCFRCRRDMPESSFTPMHYFRLPKGVRDTGEKIALHPLCHTCREQQRGKWSTDPLYSPALDRFFTRLFSQCTGGARKRGLVVAITKDDVLGLYVSQNACCALTGAQMDWRTEGSNGRENKALLRPSIDRIDSRGNYVLGNVQLVASAINIMKSDLSTAHFIDFCRAVSEHDIAKQLDSLVA